LIFYLFFDCYFAKIKGGRYFIKGIVKIKGGRYFIKGIAKIKGGGRRGNLGSPT
jgi:hypothetical protein